MYSISQTPQTGNHSSVTSRSNTPLYLGYYWLEDWLRALDKQRPVYVAFARFPLSNAQTGICTYQMTVMCAQADDAGIVHYCKLDAVEISAFHGRMVDPDHEERLAVAESLWMAVTAYLARKGFNIVEACYAFPESHFYCSGRFDGARFDPITRRFVAVPDFVDEVAGTTEEVCSDGR